MSKYKYLLFDADGTLYDWDKSEQISIEIMFKKYDIPYTDETISEYRKKNHAAWVSFEAHEITVDRLHVDAWEGFFKHYNRTDVDVVEASNFYYKTIVENSFMYPKARETAIELKERGYRIVIITNGLAIVQRSRLSDTADFAEAYYMSQDIGYPKPKREYFDAVMERHGIKEEERSKCLVIGDSINADIKGGINSGMDTVWINYNNIKLEGDIRPVYELHRIEDLLEMLPPIRQD